MEWLSDNLLYVIILGLLIIITSLFLKVTDKKNKEEQLKKKKYVELTEELAAKLSDRELLDNAISNRLVKYEEADEKQQKFIFTRKRASVLTWNKEQDVVFFVWLICIHLSKIKTPGDEMEKQLVKSSYSELPNIMNSFLDVGALQCADILNNMTGCTFDVSKIDEFNLAMEQEQPLDLCGAYIRRNLSSIAQPASVLPVN